MSNIFNFDITRMSAAEIHARALQALCDDPVEGPEVAITGMTGTDDASAPLVDELNVSAVPVLDDSAMSSTSGANSTLDNDLLGNEAPVSGARRSKRKSSSSGSSSAAPDSGHNSSTGALVFIVRILLVMNFFLSVSFFGFLL